MPFANNNGVKIHYEVEGKGPPLMLQHGFSGSLEFWRANGFARELSKDYRLILVDAQGCGSSDKPHRPDYYQADIIAKNYTTILDDLKIVKSNYFGYSMGGAIGFQCLARYALPRFNAMILGGSSPYGDVLDADKEEGEARIEALKTAVKKGMEHYVANYREKRDGPMEKIARARMLENDPKALLAVAEGISNWPSAADILPKINIPLLVFGGELDPRFPNIRECVKHLPKATFFSCPGRNHVQVMTDAKLVLPHIKKFLAEMSRNIK